MKIGPKGSCSAHARCGPALGRGRFASVPNTGHHHVVVDMHVVACHAASMDEPGKGVWVAYFHDWSAFVIFATELEALRYALHRSMSVGWSAFGANYGGGHYPQPYRDE